MKMITQKAFTLAETLITLIIVGIIAAVTIPSLINNFENHVYATRLKKSYMTVTHALTGLTTDYGAIGDLYATGLFPAFPDNPTTDTFVPKLASYLNTTNYYIGGATGAYNIPQYYLNGTYADTMIQKMGGLIKLQDGSTLNVRSGGWGTDMYVPGMCGDVMIDVNSEQKGPNRLGRDIFWFYMVRKSPYLIPRGSRTYGSASDYWTNASSLYACTDPSLAAGYGCAARVMEENWQMNY